MNKMLYEYYYVVGLSNFTTWYALKVDRETDKMYYGEAFKYNVTSIKGERFSIKKENLNTVHEITGSKNGLVYRVQVDADDCFEAEHKAREIIYDYMIDIAERFKNYKERYSTFGG